MDVGSWKKFLHSPPLHPAEFMSNSGIAVFITTDGSWNPPLHCMGCAAVIRDKYGCWIYGVSTSFGHENAPLVEVLALR